MPEEKKVEETSSKEETTPSTEQPDPQAPDKSGQTEDNQEDGRDAFYQTKYQDTKKEFDNYKATHELVNQLEDKQPEEVVPQPEVLEEIDLTSQEGVNAFSADLESRIAKNISNIITERDQQTRAEEVHKQEVFFAVDGLTKWATANKIPDEVLSKAFAKVQKDMPNSRPVTKAEYTIEAIKMNAEASRRQTILDNERVDAAKKGKELAGVEQPESGTAPEVTPAKIKTDDEITLDKFDRVTKHGSDELFSTSGGG